MAEYETHLARLQRQAIQRVGGASHARTGVAAYSPHWEAEITSLPAYLADQQLQQDLTTGSRKPINGIDGAPADPLGRT